MNGRSFLNKDVTLNVTLKHFGIFAFQRRVSPGRPVHILPALWLSYFKFKYFLKWLGSLSSYNSSPFCLFQCSQNHETAYGPPFLLKVRRKKVAVKEKGLVLAVLTLISCPAYSFSSSKKVFRERNDGERNGLQTVQKEMPGKRLIKGGET